jgi:hypothetical protein
MNVVPRMLSLAEAMVHDLQFAVLIQRRKCTTVEKSILLLQLLELTRNGSVGLIVCGQMHMLLHDGPGGVMLQVEQVLCILHHHNHAGAEVRAVEIKHDL